MTLDFETQLNTGVDNCHTKHIKKLEDKLISKQTFSLGLMLSGAIFEINRDDLATYSSLNFSFYVVW